jgi:hypothetical protein
LRQAFAHAAKLPPHEQDAIAQWLLRELEADERWERIFQASQDRLAELGPEAIAEFRAGKTKAI